MGWADTTRRNPNTALTTSKAPPHTYKHRSETEAIHSGRAQESQKALLCNLLDCFPVRRTRTEVAATLKCSRTPCCCLNWERIQFKFRKEKWKLGTMLKKARKLLIKYIHVEFLMELLFIKMFFIILFHRCFHPLLIKPPIFLYIKCFIETQ